MNEKESGLDLREVLKRAHEANRQLSAGQRYKYVFRCELHTAGAWVALRGPWRCLCSTFDVVLMSLREADQLLKETEGLPLA